MKIHTIKGYIQTTYIIEYPDKILILDSGCRPDYKKILEFVTIQLARGIKDIKLVALSHAHPDHMGGADLLQTKFQIPIAATGRGGGRVGLTAWARGGVLRARARRGHHRCHSRNNAMVSRHQRDHHLFDRCIAHLLCQLSLKKIYFC